MCSRDEQQPEEGCSHRKTFLLWGEWLKHALPTWITCMQWSIARLVSLSVIYLQTGKPESEDRPLTETGIMQMCQADWVRGGKTKDRQFPRWGDAEGAGQCTHSIRPGMEILLFCRSGLQWRWTSLYLDGGFEMFVTFRFAATDADHIVTAAGLPEACKAPQVHLGKRENFHSNSKDSNYSVCFYCCQSSILAQSKLIEKKFFFFFIMLDFSEFWPLFISIL